ncbi:MAG TPA: sodium:solute symporter family protein [Cyclobacteriaceae bacterium]|nr:sodium:solute symporter family protein [Cyclobacteriaceae bacterium]HNP08369.1 sodium:solute symporter family protein [Cyclobacteriaceae bacterium]
MHLLDYIIFALYFLGVLGVGIYFFFKNENHEDYFVGGRSISSFHVGLSIVATDVGGGFSIGLGGLGFVMGLSGSWLLFTGLVGAWLAAVFTVPKLKKLDMTSGYLTYPDFLRAKYGGKVAMFAAVISGIGYLGFTGGQILAGAKLAAGSVFSDLTAFDPLSFSLFVIAAVILLYTVLGGIKAVIYTDTVQWIVLLGGLMFLGFPFAYYKLGGWEVISAALPASHFSLTNVSAVTLINWSFTIIPIWFIAMTLYQRVYASPDVKSAKRAFFIAGVFEYPFMAFVGVGLGMLGRVAFPESDPEMALPLMLNHVLPIGITGFLLASYFSAVMSTADSCLIASSGNFTNDIIVELFKKKLSYKSIIRLSQLITLIVGVLALLLASTFQSVLDIVLQAYGFMVSGLLVPTLVAYFSKKTDGTAAAVSMIGGGGFTLVAILAKIDLPMGLDPTVFGLTISAVLYYVVYYLRKNV